MTLHNTGTLACAYLPKWHSYCVMRMRATQIMFCSSALCASNQPIFERRAVLLPPELSVTSVLISLWKAVEFKYLPNCKWGRGMTERQRGNEERMKNVRKHAHGREPKAAIIRTDTDAHTDDFMFLTSYWHFNKLYLSNLKLLLWWNNVNWTWRIATLVACVRQVSISTVDWSNWQKQKAE